MHFRRQQCRSQALKPQRAASYKVHQIGILSAEFLINAAINKRKCSVGHSCEAIWTRSSPTAPSALLYASQVGAHYIVWISVQYTEACQKLTRCISQMKYLSVWRACVSRSPITPPASLPPPAKSRFPPSLFSAPRHCPRERHQNRQNIRRCRENNLAMMENCTTEANYGVECGA